MILDVVANHTVLGQRDDGDARSSTSATRRDACSRRTPTGRTSRSSTTRTRRRATYMTDMMAHWLPRVRRRRLPLRRGRPRPDRLLGGGPAASSRRPPDLFLLAEWSTPDLMAKAFDADYAWPFHAALNRVLSLGAPASEIRATWEEERRNFPRGSLHLRFSDNHDEKRAIARFGEPAALAAQALVFTMDGIPLVYNGMEIGDTGESGGPALTERVPLFWPIVERRPEFPKFYRDDDRAAAGPPGAAPGRDGVGAVLRSGPRRLVRAARRGRGRAGRRQPVEPAVDRNRRRAGRVRRSPRSPPPCPCRSSPAAARRSARRARSSCRRSPSTRGASGCSGGR